MHFRYCFWVNINIDPKFRKKIGILVLTTKKIIKNKNILRFKANYVMENNGFSINFK